MIPELKSEQLHVNFEWELNWEMENDDTLYFNNWRWAIIQIPIREFSKTVLTFNPRLYICIYSIQRNRIPLTRNRAKRAGEWNQFLERERMQTKRRD